MRTKAMRMPSNLSAAGKFFWSHASWSYDPAHETEQQGRTRCALNLAAAEGLAREAGYSFHWEVDQTVDSRDFSDARPRWPLYACCMHDINGKLVQSLGGIDFGCNATGPYGDYRRVVEAELADQEVSAMLREAAK